MYLGSNKINKINLGSTEVKKIYQGSDLVWTNKLNYIYDFRNGTLSFPDSPDYIDISNLALENPPTTSTTNIFVQGWYITTYSKWCILPRGNSSNVTSYRSGYLTISKTGTFKITVSYMVEPFSRFYVHASTSKLTSTSAIDSTTNRQLYYYNSTGTSGSTVYRTESFEINVTTVPYYITFSAYRYRGSSYWTFPAIYSIQVEEL